jgi:nucleotide-binding universal stress UspA family protein
MFHDILVAVDGSPDAELALSHAIDLADCGHARLALFTAIAQPPRTAYWGLAAAGLAGSFSREAEAEAERVTRRARDRVPDDIPVTTIVTRQPVRPALLHQVTKGRHDLVVMGSRGRGAVRSALLGSVSHYVLHHSPVPVLIVRHESSSVRPPLESIQGRPAPRKRSPGRRAEAA